MERIEIKKVAAKVSGLKSFINDDYLTDHTLGLLEAGLSSNIDQYLLEYPYVDKDYRSTFYHDLSKRHREIKRDSYRVHLFGKTSDGNDNNRHYYGFFTLRNTPPFNLGRSYLSPKALANNSQTGYYLLADYDVSILGKKFVCRAFPWMQQDANISRCAQVAIWSIVRYFSEKYSYYAERTNQQILDLVVAKTRKIPSMGLTVEDISGVFSSVGFEPAIYWRQNDKKIFEEIIYAFIESGIPIVAGLVTQGHAIALIGHGKPELQNMPSKQGVLPTASLVKSYISVDDNRMPYSLIGEGGSYRIDDIDAIVVPLYEKMYLDIRTLIGDLLPKVEAKFGLAKRGGMLRRVFMTSSKSLKSFVLGKCGDKDYRSHLLRLRLPKFVWLAEYYNKGEYPDNVYARIVFDATGMEYNDADYNVIISKVGNKIILSDSRSVTGDNCTEPMYINNLEKINEVA